MQRNYLFTIILFLTLTACNQKPANERTVSVSILPQKYFVERIAGDFLKVNVLIPPGMSPATCDMSTEQLKQLYQSKICFTIGYLPFETTHLYPAIKTQPGIQLVNHSDNVKLEEGSCGHEHADADHHGHSVDPHIWLSPKYAANMCQTIFEVLAKQYPEQKEVFEANYRSLLDDIHAIDQKASELLVGKTNKSFLIYHPALTYFVKDYGMEQISIEADGKEPNPTQLKQIIDTIRDKNINLILIQSQFDVNNAKAIAVETGSKTISIDPLNENWLAEMNKLLAIFAENLQ